MVAIHSVDFFIHTLGGCIDKEFALAPLCTEPFSNFDLG